MPKYCKAKIAQFSKAKWRPMRNLPMRLKKSGLINLPYKIHKQIKGKNSLPLNPFLFAFYLKE